MKLLFFLILSLFIGCASAEVQELTNETFDKVIGESNIVLVKFYAPWCGHCKKLAPEFEAAATALQGKAVLAKVDCTKEKDIASRFSIAGYPTLIIFRNGTQGEKYESGRDNASIVNYLLANSGPSIESISSTEEFDTYKSTNRTACLIKTSAESDLAKILKEISPQYRNNMKFFLVTDEKVFPAVPMESVTVYRVGNEEETFKGEINTDALSSFIAKASVGYLGNVNPSNFMYYAALSAKPIGWLFLNPEKREEIIAEMLPLAKKYRDSLVMLWLDVAIFSSVGTQMGLSNDTKYPAFVIDQARKYFIFPQDLNINAKTMEDYIEKFIQGKIEPALKSESVPAKETTEGLTTIVGKTMDSFLRKGKNIFILFYAPWCGHCKSLHPIYESFAKSTATEDLIISKIDATANDFDNKKFNFSGFPTMFFIPAGSENPILYEGDRTVDGMQAFVKEHMQEVKKKIVTDEEDL